MSPLQTNDDNDEMIIMMVLLIMLMIIMTKITKKQAMPESKQKFSMDDFPHSLNSFVCSLPHWMVFISRIPRRVDC